MREQAVFEAHSSYVLGLLFTADGQTLVSAGMDNLVKLWSVPDWRLRKTFAGHDNSVNSIAMSPDQRTLATGSSDRTVKLWTFPDGNALQSLLDRKRVVSAVRFSPDGRWVAAGSYGGRVKVWTLSGEDVLGIRASEKNLSSIAFSLDGATLATCGLGGEIALWSFPSGDRIGTLSGHEIAAGSLALIEEGRTLVSMGYEQTIRFWDTATWQQTRKLEVKGKGTRGMAFSPDEQIMAISMESKVELRSVAGGALQAEIPIGTKVVNGTAFSPDGTQLAVGAADKKIRVWEI